MGEEIGQYLTFAFMWMVIYGMLAFGWVHLRDVFRTEGGLLFGALYYGYSATMVLGLAYIFAAIGLPLIGVDTSFLKPVQLLVGNLSTVVQLAGVLAVITGGALFLIRRFQKPAPPPKDTPRTGTPVRRAGKRK